MDTIDVKNQLLQAAKNNTLVTPKHDPNQLPTTYSSYRSVLSYDFYTSLEDFIDLEEYTVREYRNIRPQRVRTFIRLAYQPASNQLDPSKLFSSFFLCK